MVWRFIAAAVAALTAAPVSAGEAAPAEPGKSAWEFGITAYPTRIRGGDSYVSGIAVADRGPLHLEIRSNYESVGTRSAFVGWTFTGGETVQWELTPLIGAARGTTHATVPGFEASLAWKRFDWYAEAEYVRDRNALEDSYVYAWTELGYRPAEWLRLGIVGQRTKAYGGDRDYQRGPFAQLTWRRVTLGAYWFNPGSDEQVFISSVGVTF